MSKVFVSYKRPDKDKVFPLVREMESELGIKFWIDLEGIESDKQFNNVIMNAISDCEVFLFMYSKSHEEVHPETDWPFRELNFAAEEKKHIVFLELEACKLDKCFRFNFPQRQVTKADDKGAMNRLINDIRKWLNLTQLSSSPNIQGQTTDTKDNSMKPYGQLVTQKINDPHQAIDLGLPSGTKWASCNVGASCPEEYGDYFAWGETGKKNIYDWSSYIHCDGTQDTCHYIGKNISGTKYDVARMKWGGNWRMPTKEQFDELLRYCLYEWTTLNGVKGCKFISKINGNSIFLPAAGNQGDSTTDSEGKLGMFGPVGSTIALCSPIFALGDAFHSITRAAKHLLLKAGLGGYYWSSVLDPSGEYNAYSLSLYSDKTDTGDDSRAYGHSVRPVIRD